MRNVLGCFFWQGWMNPGVWDKHGKHTRAPKYSLLRPSCIAFPKGDGWAWGAIAQGPSDGKHKALSGPHTGD